MTVKCAQMMKPFFPVPSSSSNKTYNVIMFHKDRLPACSCVGFQTRRNKNANQVGGGYAGAGKGLAKQVTAWCKHLEKVSRDTCQWELRPGEIEPDNCPRCGGPVLDDEAVSVENGDAAIELVAMMRDLAGEPAPVVDEPEKPSGSTEFDPDTAVAELAAMLKKQR